MAEPDIDGALVGGASLDPDEFARIAKLGRLTAASDGHQCTSGYAWNVRTDFSYKRETVVLPPGNGRW